MYEDVILIQQSLDKKARTVRAAKISTYIKLPFNEEN